ncbi:hypothetical protein [Gulosibacter sp. ACHW.36C]|uniref:TolA protein n=1 Tax=Gulosibacter sediminis TaxID=1729695 RepID=A0ABY4N2Y0_9MICO|nr:hypothetical protein [Gulosibacter sediminis]UQN15583.1 hypothetical protein M3M28_03745 [Gulosibacter sediminis]
MQEFGGASSLALALIALLAVGFYVPTWVREHNARASERNAVRLQQTIRALAQTAAHPEVYELEANAREVRTQRRELKRARQLEADAVREQARAVAAEREASARLRLAEARASRQEREAAEAEMADAIARREAAARARAAAARAAQREAEIRGTCETAQERWAGGSSGSERAVERKITGQVPRIDGSREAAKRRQRGRLTATGVGAFGLLLAVIGLVVGLSGLGISLLVFGATAAVGAGWMLSRINSVWLAQQDEVVVAAAPEAQEIAEQLEEIAEARPKQRDLIFFDVETREDAAPAPANSWTPVPLPKPLYLGRATSDELDGPDGGPDGPGGKRDQMDADLAQLLREESDRSTQALRDAHRDVASLPNGVQRIRPITVGSASEWSHMGDVDAIVQDAGAGEYDDLDALLRRRRAG